jgi:hypothetical protein
MATIRSLRSTTTALLKGFGRRLFAGARGLTWGGRSKASQGKTAGTIRRGLVGATYGDLKVGGETIEGMQPQLLKVQTRDY